MYIAIPGPDLVPVCALDLLSSRDGLVTVLNKRLVRRAWYVGLDDWPSAEDG
jgi:hypothetical protein